MIFWGIPCPLASKSLIFLGDYRCSCEWPISAKTGNTLPNSRFRKNKATLLGFHFFWKMHICGKSARWRQTPLKVYRKALVIQCFARWGRAGPKDGIWMHFFDSEVQFFGKSQEKCCGDWKITEFQHLWLSQTICFPCPKAASVRSGHFHRSLAPKSACFHKRYDFYVKNAFLIQK